MAGNRPDAKRAVTPDRLPPAETGGEQTASRRLHPVLELQRSAGNRATAALVGEVQREEAPVQLMVQRSIGSWFRKKLGLKPKISKPTSGHAMRPEEQGGVPSARELMEIMEKGGAPGSSISDESVEGVGSMFEKEEAFAEGWNRGRGWDRGGTSLSDESVEGVGDMFGKAERDYGIRDERRRRRGINPEMDDYGIGGMMERSEEEAAKADDDRLYDGIKKAADVLRDPTKTKQDDQGALDGAY
jgi:hypothetical protein